MLGNMCAMGLGDTGRLVSAHHLHLHIPLTVQCNENKVISPRFGFCVPCSLLRRFLVTWLKVSAHVVLRFGISVTRQWHRVRILMAANQPNTQRKNSSANTNPVLLFVYPPTLLCRGNNIAYFHLHSLTSNSERCQPIWFPDSHAALSVNSQHWTCGIRNLVCHAFCISEF